MSFKTIKAEEIIQNGILIKQTEVSDRCAKCNEKLVVAYYRYDGRKPKKLVRCKKCGTATRLE